MANSDGKLFNVDRWAIYSRQKVLAQGNWSKSWVSFTPMTPKQLRRCKKKARKNNDQSIGIQ